MFLISGTALAQSSDTKEVDRFEPSVSGKANIESITVRLYDDGSINVKADGTISPDDPIEAYRVKVDYLTDQQGRTTPGRGRVDVETVPLATVRRKRSKKVQGGGEGPTTETRPADGDETNGGTISPLPNDSDSGVDYSTHSTGGMQVTLDQGWQNTINSGQTFRWDARNGEVWRVRDRMWCWYIDALSNIDDAYGGFLNHSWSDDKYWSAAAFQYYPPCNAQVTHISEMRARPNGSFWWKSTLNAHGCSGEAIFLPHTDYWQYCADWV